MERSVFDAAGGEQALLALAGAWHERCLQDPVVSHAFSHGGHPDHVARLAAYWGEALGGPTTYTDTMGDESQVVAMHSGQGEHQEMDDNAQACFALALDDAGLPDDDRLRSSLQTYFRWSTTTMSSYPKTAAAVPEGLPLPHWSWDGPVGTG
jgi:hemoglobin